MSEASLTATHEAARPLGGWSRQQLGLAAALLLAAAVRFGQLNAQSLSMDEVNDLQHTVAGYDAIVNYADRFPPLYYLVERAWLRAVPRDESGHALSAIFGILTVAAVARLMHALERPEAATLAAGLTAIAPLAVRYSLESRAYGLYMLLAVVALAELMFAINGNERRRWAGFVLAAVAGVYVHYYMGIFVALAGLYFLGRRPPRDTLRRGLVAFTLLGVACAPVVPLVLHDLEKPWGYAAESEFSLPALAYTYFSYLSGYTLGPSLGELHLLSSSDAARAAAPWIAILLAATLGLAWLAWRSSTLSEGRFLFTWCAVFGLAPALVVGLISATMGLGYNIRHMVWASIPLIAVLAIGGAAGRPRALAITCIAILAGAFIAADYNRLIAPEHRNEDVRGAAQHLLAAPHKQVFVLAGYMQRALQHYLTPGWRVQPLFDPVNDVAAADRVVGQIRAQAPSGRSFWLAYTREFHGDPAGLGLHALEEAFDLQPAASFAGIRLYRGQVPLAPSLPESAP